jgi:hypothetical protein
MAGAGPDDNVHMSDGPGEPGARFADYEGHKPNRPIVVVCGTIAMIVLGLALVASVINLWPIVDKGTGTQGISAMPATMHVSAHILFGLVSVSVTPSTALILLVLIVGAAGSLIHAATSFADFVGNRRLYSSWAVWYLLRLIIGMILALVVYFAVRGGFFSASSQSADVNPYGIAALAGLAGLFSKQATDKLREVFETLFQVDRGGDAARKDDLTPAAPAVASIDPPRVTQGATGVKLTVRGAHFAMTSIVRVAGEDQATDFISSDTLKAKLDDARLAEPGSFAVTVFTPPPGGGESTSPVALVVLPPA